MVWLGSVVMVMAIGLGIVVGGALGAGPMEAMVSAEAKAGEPVEAESEVLEVALARCRPAKLRRTHLWLDLPTSTPGPYARRHDRCAAAR